MLSRTILATAALLILAGCSQPSSDSASSSDPATELVRTDVPTAPVSTAPESTGPTYLTLSESTVDLCTHPDGLMATNVSWDATTVPTETIELWLKNPGEPRKLWAATVSKGSERTGEWLRNGSEVILVNKADSAVLQVVTVTEKACPAT